MKKIYSLVLVLGLLVIATACGKPSSSLESVTYGMDANGVSLSMEVKYDKDNNVQETITNNTYVYEKIGMDKEQAKEYLDTQSTMYKDMKGVTQQIEYGDKEATETLTVIVKEVSKESLPVLFSTNANDDGTVSLDTLVENFEATGFTKK